jgi:hypothetical protein
LLLGVEIRRAPLRLLHEAVAGRSVTAAAGRGGGREAGQSRRSAAAELLNADGRGGGRDSGQNGSRPASLSLHDRREKKVCGGHGRRRHGRETKMGKMGRNRGGGEGLGGSAGQLQ